MFVTQHGRDQLHANWPELYKPDQEATLPAEELMLLKAKGDYGWPECYYDAFVEKLVLAPEYGGDGGKTIGVCANKIGPIAAFPAHWAPNAMVRYDQEAISGALPRRRLHRLPRVMGPRALCARRLQRGFSAARRGPRVRPVRNICGWFRGSGEVAGAKPSIVPAAWRWDRTARSMFPTIFADGFTGLSISGGAGGGAANITPCPSLTAPAGRSR